MKSNEDMATTARQDEQVIRDVTGGEYKYGFVTDIDTHVIPVGLNEDVVRYISQVKGEPEWLLDFRLKALRHWQTMKMPRWAHLDIPDIDFQAISYYAAPKTKKSHRPSGSVRFFVWRGAACFAGGEAHACFW